MVDVRRLLFVAALLTGCADIQTGGGTDVPSPIRFVLQNGDPSSPSKSLAARECRLWSLEDQTIDSVTLVSQGVLPDSSGIFFVPPDSGEYLIEAWVSKTPPPAIRVRRRVSLQSISMAAGKGPSFSIGRSTGIATVNFSRADTTGVLDSAKGQVADFLCVVRVQGASKHPYLVVGPKDTMDLGKVLLWTLDGDSLVFRGTAPSIAPKRGLLPTPASGLHYVLEGWSPQDTLPREVTSRRFAPDLSSAWRDCAIHLGPLGSNAITLYSCDVVPGTLQNEGAAFWVPFDLTP